MLTVATREQTSEPKGGRLICRRLCGKLAKAFPKNNPDTGKFARVDFIAKGRGHLAEMHLIDISSTEYQVHAPPALQIWGYDFASIHAKKCKAFRFTLKETPI
ncbi:hypothetical protein MED193_04022 [Roseobacter sp. MED193]|nr:hypothetical protein MED193_04022 [Roseobacter sp. MED193]